MFFKPPYLWHTLWYGGLTVWHAVTGEQAETPLPARRDTLHCKGKPAEWLLFLCANSRISRDFLLYKRKAAVRGYTSYRSLFAFVLIYTISFSQSRMMSKSSLSAVLSRRVISSAVSVISVARSASVT